MIAEKAVARYWGGFGFVGLATGRNFPDALAGGVATGKEHGVLLLTGPDTLPTSTSGLLSNKKMAVARIEAFGGTGVVSDTVVSAAKALVD